MLKSMKQCASLFLSPNTSHRFKFWLQLTNKVVFVSGTDQPLSVIICPVFDQTDVNQLKPKPFVALNKVRGFFLSSFFTCISSLVLAA